MSECTTTNLTSVHFPSSYSVKVLLVASHQDFYQLFDSDLFPALFSHCSAQRVVVVKSEDVTFLYMPIILIEIS